MVRGRADTPRSNAPGRHRRAPRAWRPQRAAHRCLWVLASYAANPVPEPVPETRVLACLAQAKGSGAASADGRVAHRALCSGLFADKCVACPAYLTLGEGDNY